MAKRGLPGISIDIPLAHKDALTIHSHYDTMVFTVPDAPMPDELAIICCFANRGRLNHRIGGYSVDKVIGKDGCASDVFPGIAAKGRNDENRNREHCNDRDRRLARSVC